MNQLDKLLQRLSNKDRERLKLILVQLKEGNIAGLDIKKLKGVKNLFRVRIGTYRIICQMKTHGQMTVLTIDKRSDTTYHAT